MHKVPCCGTRPTYLISWVSKYILVSLERSIQLKGPTGRLGHRAQANDKEDKQQKAWETWSP